MHPTHPCGTPAFWQISDPDWKICAQCGGQVWCDPRMIYTALVGVHAICAILAKFSFGASDTLEVKGIRCRQMGPQQGSEGSSPNPMGHKDNWSTQLSTWKFRKQATQVVSGQRSRLYKRFPGFSKNKNKLLLISEGRERLDWFYRLSSKQQFTCWNCKAEGKISLPGDLKSVD